MLEEVQITNKASGRVILKKPLSANHLILKMYLNFASKKARRMLQGALLQVSSILFH